jgi:hypothetical protein
MTMLRRSWAMAAAGVLTLVVSPQFARADDTVRLGGTMDDAKTVTLGYDGQSDTMLMRGVHGGGFRGGFGGGFRGGFVGFRGGFGGGFRGGFVGFRGGYYGGYRGGFYGGYGGFYGGYGYWPYYAAYTPYYFPPPVCYPTPVYTYYPVGGDVTVVQAAKIYRPTYVAPDRESLPQPYGPPSGPMPFSNGTYPYDGGPANPIPLPRGADQAPMGQPVAPKIAPPTDGRLVSLPTAQPATSAANSGFAYPAYGENRPSTFGTDRAPMTTAAKRN